MTNDSYQKTRFPFDGRRETLWKTICERRLNLCVNGTSTVLEIGAGYCHIINNMIGQERIALDVWPGFVEYLRPGIRPIVGRASELDSIEASHVDLVVASNLFEHLAKAELSKTLAEVWRVLKVGGQLVAIQPNYRFCYSEYFDDYTHETVWSDRSLCDFLAGHGFDIVECIPRFLPLTLKSNLPVIPPLIALYLAIPWKPMGKQMLVRARKVEA